jgi:hypothetical protein
MSRVYDGVAVPIPTLLFAESTFRVLVSIVTSPLTVNVVPLIAPDDDNDEHDNVLSEAIPLCWVMLPDTSRVNPLIMPVADNVAHETLPVTANADDDKT